MLLPQTCSAPARSLLRLGLSFLRAALGPNKYRLFQSLPVRVKSSLSLAGSLVRPLCTHSYAETSLTLEYDSAHALFQILAAVDTATQVIYSRLAHLVSLPAETSL